MPRFILGVGALAAIFLWTVQNTEKPYPPPEPVAEAEPEPPPRDTVRDRQTEDAQTAMQVCRAAITAAFGSQGFDIDFAFWGDIAGLNHVRPGTVVLDSWFGLTVPGRNEVDIDYRCRVVDGHLDTFDFDERTVALVTR